MDECDMTAKVYVAITNSDNVVGAVHKAGWTHYLCFTHTLNVVIEDSI